MLDQGRTWLDRAYRELATIDDQAQLRRIGVFEAFVAHAEGRARDVAAILDQNAPVFAENPELRGIFRLLRRVPRDDAPALVVQDTAFTTPDGTHGDLSRHRSARRMFHALVTARAQSDVSLDVDALFEAGWPGETIHPDSMRNRVHVNLAKLRHLGLRELLLRDEVGYRLDPSVPIRHAG